MSLARLPAEQASFLRPCLLGLGMHIGFLLFWELLKGVGLRPLIKP